MDREQVRQDILNLNSNSVLLTLPTSFGKSKIGIDLALKNNPKSILIIVPRLVLIDNWKQEFIKWDLESWLDIVTFSTYVGLNKYANTKWDTIIYDECQHLTERCIEFIGTMDIKHNILLSATVSKNMLYTFKYLFKNLQVYSVKMKEAINNDILPDPKVFLVPLTLDTTNAEYTIIKHPKATNIIRCSYAERWNYIKNKNIQVHIKCTQYQYVKELNEEIEFWKKRYMITRNQGVKAKWLFLAGQRLKFLSQIKNPILLPLLERLKSQRVLTFCSSIEQTEVLGKYCINSKNELADKYLGMFNKGKIKHITACSMLDEGMNLYNCRVGLYANLNSSEIKIKQRLGRILRHKDPIIIIPYYKNTREEEIKDKMLEDYNPELIEITTINDIKL